MGFCSEDRKLEGIIPDMSVRENLTLALMPQLVATRHRGRGAQPRDRRPLHQAPGHPLLRAGAADPRTLGRQPAEGAAGALALHEPASLLILDEPTRGIDVGAKAEILSLIRELAGQGLGVLMISSELEEVVEAASRVFVLRDGYTAAELKGEALNEQSRHGGHGSWA